MNATATDTAQHIDPARRYVCRHVHTDGRRCGSPALRAQNFCYYHDRTRLPRAPLAGRIGIFRMQPIDDRAAIQIAIYDILSRLTAGDIDTKRATAVLYGLQIASSNLAIREKQQPTAEPIETLTTDQFIGDLAPIQEIPESIAQPAPAAEPATAIAFTTPTGQAEPPAQSINDQSTSAEEHEQHLPLHSDMPLAAVESQPLTLAAVQACAAQFTPQIPRWPRHLPPRYKRYPQRQSRILSGLEPPYSCAAPPRR